MRRATQECSRPSSDSPDRQSADGQSKAGHEARRPVPHRTRRLGRRRNHPRRRSRPRRHAPARRGTLVRDNPARSCGSAQRRETGREWPDVWRRCGDRPTMRAAPRPPSWRRTGTRPTMRPRADAGARRLDRGRQSAGRKRILGGRVHPRSSGLAQSAGPLARLRKGQDGPPAGRSSADRSHPAGLSPVHARASPDRSGRARLGRHRARFRRRRRPGAAPAGRLRRARGHAAGAG